VLKLYVEYNSEIKALVYMCVCFFISIIRHNAKLWSTYVCVFIH